MVLRIASLLVQETIGIPNLFRTLNSCSLRSVALDKIFKLFDIMKRKKTNKQKTNQQKTNTKIQKLKPFQSLISEEMSRTPMFTLAPIAATPIVKSIIHV